MWGWLEPALKAGTDADSRADLEQQIATGRAQLWVGDEGALVTQLVRRADGSLVHFWLGGGRMKSLLEMRPGIEAWARSFGCQFATIKGRKGWDRVFARSGYRRIGEELLKDL